MQSEHVRNDLCKLPTVNGDHFLLSQVGICKFTEPIFFQQFLFNIRQNRCNGSFRALMSFFDLLTYFLVLAASVFIAGNKIKIEVRIRAESVTPTPRSAFV